MQSRILVLAFIAGLLGSGVYQIGSAIAGRITSAVHHGVKPNAQEPRIVTASEFRLVNSEGKVTAKLFSINGGPAFIMG